MAANPNFPPPEEPSSPRPVNRPAVAANARPFAWGYVGLIVALICLGAVIYYFFFRTVPATPNHNKSQRMPSVFLWR